MEYSQNCGHDVVYKNHKDGDGIDVHQCCEKLFTFKRWF